MLVRIYDEKQRYNSNPLSIISFRSSKKDAPVKVVYSKLSKLFLLKILLLAIWTVLFTKLSQMCK